MDISNLIKSLEDVKTSIIMSNCSNQNQSNDVTNDLIDQIISQDLKNDQNLHGYLKFIKNF